MKNPKIQMTREEMQIEAVIIESLLSAVVALHSGNNSQDAIILIEMAHDRAEQLNAALDCVNVLEVAA
jgi:hypothetical protein